MSDIVERMRWWGAKRRPPRNMTTFPADCAEAADEIERLTKERDDFKDDYFRRHKDAGDRMERALLAESRVAELEKALEPFAKAGQVIDSPFGPALFREDDMAFQSGCAWSENSERRTITWGDFRRARAAFDAIKEGK